MTAPAPPRETPHVGIFWLVQTPNGEMTLLAAGYPLDQAEPYGDCLTYGPATTIHGRVGAATNLSIPRCAPWCGRTNTKTGRADALSSIGRAISSSCMPIACSSNFSCGDSLVPAPRPYLIEGYAIVSADCMIADANGTMDALKL